MPALEFERFVSDADQFAYRPAGGKPGTYLFVYRSLEAGDYSRHRSGLQHLAFMVRRAPRSTPCTSSHVGLGSEIVHEPRVLPRVPAALLRDLWLDPHGFLLEAVCHHDRSPDRTEPAAPGN